MGTSIIYDITQDVDGLDEIGELMTKTIIPIVGWAIGIIGVLILMAIGLKWMSTDQAEERQKLKSRLIAFAVGVGIVLLADTIWTILVNVYS